MRIIFTLEAWEDYVQWQKEDKKMVEKINKLIKECIRNPYEGIRKPEPLKFDLAGFWSRKINREHRLVYQWSENELKIFSCQYHY